MHIIVKMLIIVIYCDIFLKNTSGICATLIFVLKYPQNSLFYTLLIFEHSSYEEKENILDI